MGDLNKAGLHDDARRRDALSDGRSSWGLGYHIGTIDVYGALDLASPHRVLPRGGICRIPSSHMHKKSP